MRTFLSMAFLLATAGAGFAQGSFMTREEQEKACKPDVTKYCRNVIEQGDMVILQCLQVNRSRLTRSCRRVLEENGQ